MLSILLVPAACVCTASAQGPRFVGVGQLPGVNSSMAMRVSDDGSVVVGASYTSGGNAFVWTAAGGIQAIAGGQSTTPHGVSGDGTVIVGEVPYRPVRSSQAGPVQLLPTLHPNDGGYAMDANHDGSVIVGSWRDLNGSSAARWTTSGIELLPNLPTLDRADVAGVSDNGTVIAGACLTTGGAMYACRWTASGVQQIGGYNEAMPAAISNNGNVIVGRSPAGGQAMRWTASGGWVSLGSLPGTSFSNAYDTNFDGSIVVGQCTTGTQEQAIVWTQALGMVPLRQYLTMNGVTGFDGWTLSQANGISADGYTIVGYGLHNGLQEGFVAVVPAPGALLAAPIALCFAMRRKRRA